MYSDACPGFFEWGVDYILRGGEGQIYFDHGQNRGRKVQKTFLPPKEFCLWGITDNMVGGRNTILNLIRAYSEGEYKQIRKDFVRRIKYFDLELLTLNDIKRIFQSKSETKLYIKSVIGICFFSQQNRSLSISLEDLILHYFL